MAPAVGRAVHSRVQRAQTAAQRTASDAEQAVARWGERLLGAVTEAGQDVLDQLPTGSPAPWPPPPAPREPALEPLYPPPPVYLAPWPYPLTNFRQQTGHRPWRKMGRL